MVMVVLLGSFLSWSWVLAHMPRAVAEQISPSKKVLKTPQPPTIFTRTLDGVVVDSADSANPYPVGIMIENLPTVRPQTGLAGASVVYETLAEGGSTRFLALYAGAGDHLNTIGPVRSARSYYLEWLSEYDGLFAHAGGSPDALQMIEAFGIKALNGIGRGAQYFWRDRGLSAPHNLFTSSELLTRALRDTGLDTAVPIFTPWRFKDDRDLSVRPGSGQYTRIHFSGRVFEVEYRYDQATNTYLRSNGGELHVDALTHQQLRANNVIVQMIPPILGVGEKGRLTLDVTGQGQALMFLDGGVNIGTWKKEGRTGRTQFFFENGDQAELNRGATWIAILPSDSKVEYGPPAF